MLHSKSMYYIAHMCYTSWEYIICILYMYYIFWEYIISESVIVKNIYVIHPRRTFLLEMHTTKSRLFKKINLGQFSVLLLPLTLVPLLLPWGTALPIQGHPHPQAAIAASLRICTALPIHGNPHPPAGLWMSLVSPPRSSAPSHGPSDAFPTGRCGCPAPPPPPPDVSPVQLGLHGHPAPPARLPNISRPRSSAVDPSLIILGLFYFSSFSMPQPLHLCVDFWVRLLNHQGIRI